MWWNRCSFSLRVRNRERGWGRSNETNNLDPARKLWDAAVEKKCQKFTFGSDEEGWCAVCLFVPPCAIWVCCQFLVDAHAKFWIRWRAAEQRNVKLCRYAVTHEHTPTHSNVLSDTHVYYHGWCWGKSLVAGRRSQRRDFMANTEIWPLVREHGLVEVQKQRESQMDTLDKHRGITRDNITE